MTRVPTATVLWDHVLVIEDETNTAMILAAYMKAFGCRSVDHAATEIGAVWMAEDRRPDLMVVDLRLRDGNGLSAAMAIRETYGTPMIVVTVYPPDAAQLDPKLVVPKPFTAGTLRAAVVHASLTAARPDHVMPQR